MASSLNKVMLIGNLGKDPELKMTPAGQPVARFTLATTETWKTPQGEKQSKTEWHNIVVWGKQAEIAEKFLRKGKQIHLEGRIQYREYTDQAGVKKTICEIRCETFIMLGGARGDDENEGYKAYGKPAALSANMDDMQPPPGAGEMDSDIPF